MFQGGAIETTSAGGRAVRELAAEKIDASHELLQNVEPAAFDIPTQRFVSAGSPFAGGFLGRVLPKILAEVFVFQDAKHQWHVVLENRDSLCAGLLTTPDPALRRPSVSNNSSGPRSVLKLHLVPAIQG